MPMLVLSFAWLGLFIIELVWGLSPILEAIGSTIWIAFIYGTALWWTAMMMATMGSDYFPKTAEGQVLCFLLALYAVVFGYLTATLATFFIYRDADSDDAELASAKSIKALQTEITALRTDIQALMRRDVDQG